jgi:hypothetical protein
MSDIVTGLLLEQHESRWARLAEASMGTPVHGFAYNADFVVAPL